MIGKIVKFTTKSIKLLNQRVFTAILFLIGIAASVYIFPTLATEGVTKREAAGIILLVILPYLIAKGIILIMLLFLDITINFSAKSTYIYKMNFERAKARVSRLYIDKGIPYVLMDNFEFGIEKYLVVVMQKYLTGTKFNYPVNVISSTPFVVARIYDMKNGTVQAKVLYEEEREAEVMGRLIIASLQALESEEKERVPSAETTFSAGAIKLAPAKPQDAAVQIDIPGKGAPKPIGLMEKLKFKKKKK
ncbi:MAG: hypothetical protein V1835_03165 [Candidatus Micrarchaeota archaeon]